MITETTGKTMLENTSRRKGTTFFLLITALILLAGCGKERKNIVAKSYHATNSFFNGYYNATRILKETRDQMEESYTFEDNDLIKIYTYPTAEDSSTFEADMEKITEKNDIVIFKHPNGGFEDDCRLLTGISYFYRREWKEARNNFEYIINSMEGSSRIPEAQIWMAMSYYQEGQIELAADYLQAHIFDYDTVKLKPRIRGRLAALGSQLAVDTANYAAATDFLLDNVKKVRGRKNKTEAYFLLGQLADRAEKYPEALEAFAKVQRMSKDYEFVFMSKMKTASLYTKYQGGKDDENLVYEYLNKLLKDPKNEPYHDRIYYQFGTLAVKKDSLEAALGHFRKAVSGEHARTKALAGFKAGNIFYREFQQYDSAQVYYNIAAAAVSEDAPEYEEIKTIAEVFGRYVEYKTTIVYQDSMLWLASLSDEERKAAITKVIEIEREKERKAEAERLAKQKAEEQAIANARGQFGGTGADRFADQLQNGRGRQRASNFYFDNPGAVSQGMQQFKQRWGTRANEDNWRRINKAATFGQNTEEIAEQARKDSIQLVKDSVLVKEFGNDYQFYKDVPRNDTMVAESKGMIEEAMFKLGQLYFQRMNEPDSSIKTFEGLLDRFDPTDFELEARYALYQLYKAKDDPLQYIHYNYIINEYPNTVYAYLLQGKDPRELANIEDDYLFAYTGLFASYRDRQYETAIGFGDFLLEQFANNKQLDMAELNYIRGMSYGYLGFKDSLRSILTEVIKNFPESDVTPKARLTLEYMQNTIGGTAPPLPKSGTSSTESENSTEEPGLEDPNNQRYRDFGKTPKAGEKIFVLMFVDQEGAKARGLTKSEINSKIGDFNKRAYPKLKPFTFQYKGTILLPYVSHFTSVGEGLGYVEAFSSSQAGQEVLAGPGDKIFYISHSNFKVAYGRKRLEDYILFYENILEKK